MLELGPQSIVKHLVELRKTETRARESRERARILENKRVRIEAEERAYAEKRREDLRRNSATYRERRRMRDRAGLDDLMVQLDASLEPAIVSTPTPDLIAEEVAAFRSFLIRGGRRAGQLKGRRRELMQCRVVLLEVRAQLGQDPSYGTFGEWLTRRLGGEWKKDKVVAIFRRLKDLEGPDGPWAPTFPDDGGNPL